VFGGIGISTGAGGSIMKTIRDGASTTIFTIGYERRSLDDLLSTLRQSGIDKLIDVREKPISRKPDFREGVLAAACNGAGIEYESWKRLGSTSSQRQFLKDSGDVAEFMRRFRSFVRRGRAAEINQLSEENEGGNVALLCYERAHDECHRSVIADLVADATGACVVAIQ
jgi:uncharacterized protein (DUF488 family)